jgi:hypothetical protein
MFDLNKLYGSDNYAIADYAFNEIHKICWDGFFDEINDILIEIEFDKVSIQTLLIVTTCANWCKSELPEWSDFLTRVREHILTKDPSCDIENVMHGFTP